MLQSNGFVHAYASRHCIMMYIFFSSPIKFLIFFFNLSAHIVKIFIFLSDSIYHPMNFCERKI